MNENWIIKHLEEEIFYKNKAIRISMPENFIENRSFYKLD